MADRALGAQAAVDVAIVGAGPAGLSAAVALKRAGLARVLVLEREGEAGGVPRHCGHPPYGLFEFGRIMTGPRYAKTMVARALRAGVEIAVGTTVTALEKGPLLRIASAEGAATIAARKVLLATGVRETSRAARAIGGTKPGGVMNTGALQGLVYLKGMVPFRRPVIVGSELVAFSAILTCRHAKIRPVAMVEPNAACTARWPCALFPQLLGIALHRASALEAIHGSHRVEAVTLRRADGSSQTLQTDGVILCGGFRSDAVLVRDSHLERDAGSGGPVVDQFGRTSDPDVFAAGNLLRPVETAGWCAREGARIARAIAQALAGALPPPSPALCISPGASGLALCVPQRLVPGAREGPGLELRAARAMRGRLALRAGGVTLASRMIDTRPERRVLFPLHALPPDVAGEASFVLEEAA